MRMEITGHHVEITDSMRAYVVQKFEKLERHFPRAIHAHVVLQIEKERMKAEARISLGRGDVFADAEDDNMYTAVDQLIDKLDRQITKHKERLADRYRKESDKPPSITKPDPEFNHFQPHLSDLLAPERILCRSDVASKKCALEELARLLAQSDETLSPGKIFDCLLARERLSNTGIGNGVAMPHGYLENNKRMVGACIQLRHSIDFDAEDGKPVDLAFSILLPADHRDRCLGHLSGFARMLDDRALKSRLRRMRDPRKMLQLLADHERKHPPSHSILSSPLLNARVGSG